LRYAGEQTDRHGDSWIKGRAMELLPTLKTCTENVIVFGRVHGFLRYIRDRLTDEQTSGVDETDIGLRTDTDRRLSHWPCTENLTGSLDVWLF